MFTFKKEKSASSYKIQLIIRQNEVEVLEQRCGKKSNGALEGYLFKRGQNAFRTWNRRWFYLHNNQLCYKKRTDGDDGIVMEEDLRLCLVRPLVDIDRRFCFEVISPMKSHVLQADSEDVAKVTLHIGDVKCICSTNIEI